jgi:hypothetical protein
VIRIVADDIGGHGAVEHIAAAFKDIFYDRRRVHRIVDRLTDELVVKWLKSRVQGQKEHSEPLDFSILAFGLRSKRGTSCTGTLLIRPDRISAPRLGKRPR